MFANTCDYEHLQISAMNSNLDKWPMFSLLDDDVQQSINIACVFGPSGNEAVFVTHDDEVYAFGANCSGCLGLGEAHSSLEIRKVEGLCKKQISQFSFGSGPHVLAITCNGELYTWGHNGYCQLGNGSTAQCLTPSLITVGLSNKKVTSVACGSHHSLLLTADGEVFAWGQNNCGQIGSGTTSNQPTPRKVTSLIGSKRIVVIACGQSTSMVAANTGELFSWGYNGNGQIGIGTTTNQPNPYRITTLGNLVITQIALGYAHSLALTDEGVLYAWGANSYGQLGTGDKTTETVPMLVNSIKSRIVEIAATHYNHISACQTDNGKIFMWGQCRGQSVVSPVEAKCSSISEVFAGFGCPAVTPDPLKFENPQNQTTVAHSMQEAFDEAETSDIKFKIEGKIIHAHKAFLKIRCSYFNKMFQAHWEESQREIIEVEDYSYPVYRAFLYYLYTDKLDLGPEEAISLLDLANAYCEKTLKTECQKLIRYGITKENAAMLYAAAVKYEAKELEDFCFKFSLNHMTTITQTEAFAKLDEANVKNFIRKAAQHGAFKH